MKTAVTYIDATAFRVRPGFLSDDFANGADRHEVSKERSSMTEYINEQLFGKVTDLFRILHRKEKGDRTTGSPLCRLTQSGR